MMMTSGQIKEIFDLRPAVFGRVFGETRGQPTNVRTAKALAEFLRAKPIYISENDILAGSAQFCSFANPSFDTDFFAEIKACEAASGRVDKRLYEFNEGMESKLFQRGPGGHVIAGYDYVLEKGVDYLIDHARACVAKAAGYAREVAEASGIICAALSLYIERYAALAQSQGMNRIADMCAKLAHDPPDTFYEAVQLMWLLHEVVVFEQYCGSMSLGRIDQTLWPFYKNDLEAGRITREEARDIIESFFLKLGGLRRGYQNVTLGGSNRKGEYEGNELSTICLEVSGKLKIDQPLLSVRYAPGMSDDFWESIMGLLEIGIGFPALFNDRIAAQSKIKLGVDEGDAYNYGIVGCVEVSVPGKEFAHTEGLRVNWAKIIELMFNNGKCLYTGHTFALAENRDLDSVKSFDEFYEWYKRELVHFLDLGVNASILLDENYGINFPTPYMSSLMRGCIEKGKDVNAGGAVYNLSTVNGCGMADAVDSLCAVRKAVFEDGICTLPKLAQILRDNFKGSEDLKRILENDCPKFGNDDDRSDFLMSELTGLFSEKVSGYTNPRGGKFQSGLYTVTHHALMGMRTGALPSGRSAGISLANGFSPFQGADRHGPTAVINSIVKNDLSLLGNGMVLDLKFQPQFFRKNRIAIRHLIETYFDLGGYEMQFNVVDRETLVKARKEPEKYRGLIVRVSGFSAYFVDLEEQTQDEIIARTEHA